MSLGGLRSFISTYNPRNPAQFILKSGDKVGIDRFVEKFVPDARPGSYFWLNPLQANGALQTYKASVSDKSKENKIWYGRRLFTWSDGSLISVDYVLDKPSSTDEWNEQSKYSPIDNSPPLFERTRYLSPEEITHRDDPDSSKPLLISLHGLTGGSHEMYVRATINEMKSRSNNEFEFLVINSRGCARTIITTPQLFCAVFTDDIRRLVKFIRKTQPKRKIYLVGYSLGASILSNYLGQEGDKIEVDGAVAVANPWDLSLSGHILHDSWMGQNVYSAIMTKNLLNLVKHHKNKLIENPWAKKAIESDKKPKFIYEFDDQFTAPIFGFVSVGDYYRNASSILRLPNIRTPTLILNSVDDPIIGGDSGIPYREANANPYTVIVTTSIGGHLGWYKADGSRWYTPVVADFFMNLYHQVDGVEANIDLPKRVYKCDRLVYDNVNLD